MLNLGISLEFKYNVSLKEEHIIEFSIIFTKYIVAVQHTSMGGEVLFNNIVSIYLHHTFSK